jgi:demethoxyubiquinone hydroxylase (CLK1/Coq7/Cat5 family)
MGEKAAHACTEAVESVIEEHYADQIAELRDRDPALAAELSVFRDEELAHHDHAVDRGAAMPPATACSARSSRPAAAWPSRSAKRSDRLSGCDPRRDRHYE